eukprot:CAMPEP_0118963162 /NCGR_PEP_ID=MMETSP1173-20130426/1193_1 /TAXON_ID=1034831 /ORGANISM="Rhizochromulina marina cf, Strain CCMP1243" /LENGTH=212 /DNA_ID=CAMNT_0006911479 /DNA_START=1 /DNA_END=639 /DNA_ORIENTATION=-
MRGPRVWWSLGLLVLSLRSAVALQVDLEPNSKRCLGEDMAEDAMGKFSFFVVPSSPALPPEESRKAAGVRVQILAPSRSQLMAKDLTYDVSEFTFTAHNAGMHHICFMNQKRETKRVNLEIETDLVKDYSELVKQEHLKPLELQFRKAEDKLKSISHEMGKSREREAQLKQTSETMSSRIQSFSLLSITVLLVISAWQMYYLKSFFRAKKLL